jgi:PAS domain S-box-containing protein
MEELLLRMVIFTGVIVDFLCTLIVVALWIQNRKRYRGLGFWAIDFLLQAIGLSLIVLRGNIADWLSIVFSNTVIITGTLLGLLGLERFTGRRGRQIHNYVLLAAFPLIHSYFVYVRPNLEARNLNLTVALLIICGQCLWLMLHRIDAPLRQFAHWVTAVFSVYCLVCVLRIFWILLNPFVDADYFHSGILEIFLQVIFEILFILLTYSFALMVNKRLLLELQTQEEKYSKAFHSSFYAIMLTRLSDGKLLEVNAGFEKITGYSQKEVVGRTTADLHFWSHVEDRKLVIKTLMQRGSVRSLELQFTNKSGIFVTGLFSAEIITIGGEQCILASINDISERKRAEDEREKLVSERESAILKAKTLSGLLPICASCKKIRDDKGYWSQIEAYIKSHSEVEFSHGICPECMKKLYSEYAQGDLQK